MEKRIPVTSYLSDEPVVVGSGVLDPDTGIFSMLIDDPDIIRILTKDTLLHCHIEVLDTKETHEG